MKHVYLVLLAVMYLYTSKMAAQCATPSVIPYYEGFTGIAANNQLPACWAVSNAATCLTYTGNGNTARATFSYSPAGSSYFFTNAIYMQAGITYSISVWHKVTNSTLTWTDLSLFIGPNQNTSGLFSVASTGGPVTNTAYAPLSNTFVVPASGNYYVAVRGTSNGASASPELSWDDLSITIPCTSGYNTPSITVTPASATVCAGSQLTVSASGADTYTWNTGVTGATLSDSPTIANPNYTVAGTSTLSGCGSTAAVSLVVRPVPSVVIAIDNASICRGFSALLFASVTGTYSSAIWSNGQQTAQITVTPTLTTVYSVTCTNGYGCSTTATNQVMVNLLPVVSVTNSASALCVGETVTLTAFGATSYKWMGQQGSLTGSRIFITPSAAGTISLNIIGTDNHGCTDQLDYFLIADACTGLNKPGSQNRIYQLYPNPGNGTFIISSEASETKSITISDALGKIVFVASDNLSQTKLDLNHLATGIYQVQVSSGASAQYLKLVKE